MEYGGRRAVVPIVFGEPEDTPIFGTITLESLGYQVDPVSKKLKPIELLMISTDIPWRVGFSIPWRFTLS